MKEHIKIDASVASHKGNIHSKNEEKFYLNGQYMDLNQQKDSTSKSATHSYKQSVYGVASGTVRGARGEQAAFIAIEALSRYHLYLEENGPTSFAEKKQRLLEHLESAKEKIKELSEKEDIEDLGATMVGLIIDENRAFGFSIGEEGFYMVEEDAVRRVPLGNLQIHYYIGSGDPIEKILRVTDEFLLDQGDRILLTSKNTYMHAMEGHILRLINALSTKDSTKSYIKELLTKEGQKNLTALLIHVEALGGYVANSKEGAFAPGVISSHGEEEQQEVKQEDPVNKDSVSNTEEDKDHQGPEKVKESKKNSKQKEDPKQKESPKQNGNPKQKDDQGLKEDPERDRIFEQRYAESQRLFNKKLQQEDFGYSAADKSTEDWNRSFGEDNLGDGFEEDVGKNADFSGHELEGFDEESLVEAPEDEENPWRTRSKLLLVALLAVGVIVMAFAFGTIRNLEQRIFNSSAENVNGEEAEVASGEDPIDEEPGEETGDGEEAGEELGVGDDEEDDDVSDEDSDEEENLEESEEPVTEPEETEEEEPEDEQASESVGGEEIEETYEIQSGDTIFSISRAFYGDGSMVDEIIRLNNIEDINNIQVGDVLRLPPQE